MENTPVISVRDLNVHLGEHHILQNLTFDIAPGEVVCIVGPNGSGKTTLVKTLLGLLPYKGEVTILGETPRGKRKKIGYVPQQVDFDRTIPLTVRDLFNSFSSAAERNDKHYREYLTQVKADHLLDRTIGMLSGGEFQRVLMALALHGNPEILILDEPAAGVDVEGEAVLYEMLSELREHRSLTILMVSHDLSVVYRYATSVLCINHEMVCHGIPQEVLTAETLGSLYGPGAIYRHPERPHPEVPHRH